MGKKSFLILLQIELPLEVVEMDKKPQPAY